MVKTAHGHSVFIIHQGEGKSESGKTVLMGTEGKVRHRPKSHDRLHGSKGERALTQGFPEAREKRELYSFVFSPGLDLPPQLQVSIS